MALGTVLYNTQRRGALQFVFKTPAADLHAGLGLTASVFIQSWSAVV